MVSGTIGGIHAATARATGLTAPQRAAILLGAASAIMWAILIAGLWVTIPPCVLHLVQPGSATATLAAVVLWVADVNGRKAGDVNQVLAENNGVTLDTLYNLTRHAAARVTGPLRRVK